MSYVVNTHLSNLYVLSNKTVGPGKKSKIINIGPTSIPEARVQAGACMGISAASSTLAQADHWLLSC